MRNVKAPPTIDTWRVICATQSEPDYSENRQILLYGGDFASSSGPFVLLEGGHCSCYDWEEVEWDATEYTRDEILTLAESKSSGAGCYDKSEKAFWRLVRYALVWTDD